MENKMIGDIVSENKYYTSVKHRKVRTLTALFFQLNGFR